MRLVRCGPTGDGPGVVVVRTERIAAQNREVHRDGGGDTIDDEGFERFDHSVTGRVSVGAGRRVLAATLAVTTAYLAVGVTLNQRAERSLRATLEREFRFVLADSSALAGVSAEPRPFREHIGASGDGVVAFPNLGGDAVLVVPEAATSPEHYAHLASFVRGAPAGQIDELWRATGRAVRDWLDNESRPVWLSTSGLGVYWVHVRLDSRPKYYTHAPYRRPPGQ